MRRLSMRGKAGDSKLHLLSSCVLNESYKLSGGNQWTLMLGKKM